MFLVCRRMASIPQHHVTQCCKLSIFKTQFRQFILLASILYSSSPVYLCHTVAVLVLIYLLWVMTLFIRADCLIKFPIVFLLCIHRPSPPNKIAEAHQSHLCSCLINYIFLLSVVFYFFISCVLYKVLIFGSFGDTNY